MGLHRTFDESYAIEVRQGVIWVLPPSAAPYALPPNDPRWLQIASEIASLIGIDCFCFSHHTTKLRPERKDDQLTLVFDDINHAGTALAFFNVSAKYQRNTEFHKAGSARAQGEFRPPANGKLVKMFKLNGLQLPKKLSYFKRAIAQLHGRIFTAQLCQANHLRKLDNSTINTLNIKAGEIAQLLNRKKTATSDQAPANSTPSGDQDATINRDQAFPENPYRSRATGDFKYKQDLVQTTSNTYPI